MPATPSPFANAGGGGGGGGSGQVAEERPRREGTTPEFVVGFAMGFLLGVIMIFWLYDSTISRRQRMGIIAGLTTNVVMQLYGGGGESSAGKSGSRGGGLRGGSGSSSHVGSNNDTDVAGGYPRSELVPLSAFGDSSASNRRVAKPPPPREGLVIG